MSLATLVRAELLKLRTVRTVWLLSGIGLAITIAFTAIILSVADHDASTVGDVVALCGFASLFVAIACALGMTQEYANHTIATAFTLVPQRGRVLSAKALAALLVGLLVGLAFVVVAVGPTAVVFAVAGDGWPWSVTRTLEAIAGPLVIVGTMAVVGVGLGAITRSSGGAVTAILVVYLVVDSLLSAFVPFWEHFGIGAAQLAVLNPSSAVHYGFATGLVANLVFALLFLGGGWLFVRRTDV